MQFFNTQDNVSGMQHGQSARLFPNLLGGEESLQRPLAFLFVLVSLAHLALIAYWRRTPEPDILAEPLVMEVALIAAPAPPAAKPVPPSPPVAPAKPQPKPVQAKKAPVTPKKKPVIPKKTPAQSKPVSTPAPTPEPAPAAKPEPVSSSAQPSPPAPLAAPARPAAPAQPKADTFTEANYRANYKSNPKPDYPRLAKSRGWQGKVLLRVQVSADGHSAAVSVQQSSGHRLLDDAAMEAVKNWTFIPAKRGDTPVASTVTVPIQFKMNE